MHNDGVHQEKYFKYCRATTAMRRKLKTKIDVERERMPREKLQQLELQASCKARLNTQIFALMFAPLKFTLYLLLCLLRFVCPFVFPMCIICIGSFCCQMCMCACMCMYMCVHFYAQNKRSIFFFFGHNHPHSENKITQRKCAYHVLYAVCKKIQGINAFTIIHNVNNLPAGIQPASRQAIQMDTFKLRTSEVVAEISVYLR